MHQSQRLKADQDGDTRTLLALWPKHVLLRPIPAVERQAAKFVVWHHWTEIFANLRQRVHFLSSFGGVNSWRTGDSCGGRGRGAGKRPSNTQEEGLRMKRPPTRRSTRISSCQIKNSYSPFETSPRRVSISAQAALQLECGREWSCRRSPLIRMGNCGHGKPSCLRS